MYQNKRVTAVIVAAGSSRRMGFNKLLYEYAGRPVIAHTAAAFAAHPLVDAIVLVTGANDAAVKAAVADIPKITAFVPGGADRLASVTAGVAAVEGEEGIVAIQDGARPFVSARIITQTIQTAARTGAAAPAVPVKDTIKQAGSDRLITATPPRHTLFAVQTPQVFGLAEYRAALAALPAGAAVTDDCSVFELAGRPVTLTEGDYANLKITTREDLPAEKEQDKMRIGHGYDVHRLVEERDLILGGQKIPYEKGLLGHSDADVLAHAVMDALLGAAALGDIGKHFPDKDPQWKGADSMKLMAHVALLLKEEGWRLGNLDATILCQAPKLAPYIPAMRQAIADVLGADVGCVSVKATTEEKLGFTGAGQGIAAHAVCLLLPL